MKLYVLFALIFVLVGTQANKKEQWRAKKARHMSKHDGGLKVNMADFDKLKNAGEYDNRMKSHKMKHYFAKKLNKGKFGAKKALKKTHKTMTWLNLKSDMDCDLKCKHGEICISGPVVNKPICVHKKDLKKSMKLFHRYHKKEMKAWRKYQKKNYRSDWKNYKSELKNYKTDLKNHKTDLKKYKSEWKLEKEEKYGKVNNHDLASMMKDKLGNLDKKIHFSKKLHKKGKHHHISHPKHKETVCDKSEFGQMKTRMIGWFHLLHGQDHAARKAHGGSIAKFYKHVSVKKELRDMNGERCECMKSAMWQFHQMDKDHNEYMTESELTFLEENSLEPCMRPYLESCDRDGDKKISSDEWCCCFTNILPPCYKQINDIRKEGKPVTYMPRCDKEGYYMHEQCKGDTEEKRVCWCVDYNGNEYADTSRNGRAHCSKIAKYGYKKKLPFV